MSSRYRNGRKTGLVEVNAKRIDSMIAHVQKLSTKGRALFLFTDIPTLTASKDRILSLPWKSGAGEMVRIVD